MISAWEQAQAEGKGVVVVDGRLAENLHVKEARRVLALERAIGGLATPRLRALRRFADAVARTS